MFFWIFTVGKQKIDLYLVIYSICCPYHTLVKLNALKPQQMEACELQTIETFFKEMGAVYPQAVTLIIWNPWPTEVSNARQCVFQIKESTHFVSSGKECKKLSMNSTVFLQPGTEVVDKVWIQLPAAPLFQNFRNYFSALIIYSKYKQLHISKVSLTLLMCVYTMYTYLSVCLHMYSYAYICDYSL